MGLLSLDEEEESESLVTVDDQMDTSYSFQSGETSQPLLSKSIPVAHNTRSLLL